MFQHSRSLAATNSGTRRVSKKYEKLSEGERMTYLCGSPRWALGTLVLSMTSVSALAQSTPATDQAATPAGQTTPTTAPSVSNAGGLTDIVVTARRRAESLSRVPVTVTALSAASLVQRGIHSESDLQSAVAGLTVRAGNRSDQINYVIRGESLDQYSGSQPGVQPYLNEVPQIANTATIFYDLDGVQALKGPQGTLFGRNSTGGAVLVQTAGPTSDFGGYLSGQYGNLNRLITEGALNLPLISDKVMLRLAGTYSSGGAFIRNIYDDRKRGEQLIRSGRATLLLKPTDGFSNKTVVQIGRFGGTNQPDVPYFTAQCGDLGGDKSCQFAPSVPAFQRLINGTGGVFPGYPAGFVYPGGLGSLQAYQNTLPRYTVDQNASFDHKFRTETVSNTTTFDVSPTLSIKNIFGYDHSFGSNHYDNDNSPYPILQAGVGSLDRGNKYSEVFNARQFSDELQAQGKAFDGKLTYIVGGFYVNYREENNSPITGVYIVPAFDLLGEFDVRYHSTARDKSAAVFAQLTYALTDRLNVTVGGRYTRDRLSLIQADDSDLNNGTGLQKHHEAKPSWTGTLDYRFTPELMVYATTRGSWRAGGYGPFGLPLGQKTTAQFGGNYFKPETVRDVEVGAKFNGRLGDIPLQANVDIYNAWIKNLQKNAFVVVPGLGTINSATVTVPAAKVSGIEADLNLRPTDWLRLGGNFSYTDARFTKNVGFINGLPTLFGPYGDTPKYSGSLYALVSAPLPNGAGALSYRADVYAQSSFYFSNSNDTLTPGTKIPGYGLVNMRLDWEKIMGSQVTASLFVKNLTDKYYFLGGSAASLINAINHVAVAPPRTYGFVLRAEF